MTDRIRSPQSYRQLFPKSSNEFSIELFKTPPAEYRGAPFWAWNNQLDQKQLLGQIQNFKDMGLGGFFMHSRTGLKTDYLSDDFMSAVEACVDRAKELGMYACLYDEDRWPSGSAGGLVTEKWEFRAKHILFTPFAYGTLDSADQDYIDPLESPGKPSRNENGRLWAKYDIELDEEGYLISFRRLSLDKDVDCARNIRGRVWYAYVETAAESEWHNKKTYVDTLNKKAIQRFLQITHDRYYQVVGQEFGKTIPAIFTDEPQFARKSLLVHATDIDDCFMPWTDDLPDSFQAEYGYDLANHFPELFWENRKQLPSLTRYNYHNHVCERFVGAFGDTIGQWCKEHQIALTGHMMEEPTLHSQTSALGEAMRAYRAFSLPGIDILLDRFELNTAKQAQSVSHQNGNAGILSEMYGATNWTFDFRNHKGQGDWQAALGVTLRCLHLSLVSMAGESKRDYPASINYQSTWYKEYSLVEDHFARVNSVMTRGRPCVHVGVIHPIESSWLCLGPADHTSTEQHERDENFLRLTEWLLFGMIDFDFISESLFPAQCLVDNITGDKLSVGHAQYKIILVPNLRNIRSTTLLRLQRFREKGGAVYFIGESPTVLDAKLSEAVNLWIQKDADLAIPFARISVLNILEPYREIKALSSRGHMARNLLHQIRDEKDERFVFICNTDRNMHGKLEYPDLYQRLSNCDVSFRGEWHITLLDSLSGGEFNLGSVSSHGWTTIKFDLPSVGSAVFRLTKTFVPKQQFHRDRLTFISECPRPISFELSEPNVLLLDQARFRLAGEKWQGPEEILRIDNVLREELGLTSRAEAFAQPWTDKRSGRGKPTRVVELAFTITSQVSVSNAFLALENATETEIYLDDVRVTSKVGGYWVDEAIEMVPLPSFEEKEHRLVLKVPFGLRTNLERVYVLGNFGVEVHGRFAKIVATPNSLTWGDWTHMGFPFYAGNLTYSFPFRVNKDNDTIIQIPHFRAPLLKIAVDGKQRGHVAFPPYQINVGKLVQGEHTATIQVFGNRQNAFGAIHLANTDFKSFGPEAWRTKGYDWSYEYVLDTMGVLAAPKISQSQDDSL